MQDRARDNLQHYPEEELSDVARGPASEYRRAFGARNLEELPKVMVVPCVDM